MRPRVVVAVVCLGSVVAALLAAPLVAQRSSPAVAAAHRAQRDFEQQRRTRLPVSVGGGAGGPCEVTIGRLCYWNNNSEAPPPAEPRAIAERRDTLLAKLAHAAALVDSTDEWVVGQRVRYLAEAHRLDDAVDVAERCHATVWWCDALRGLAHHERGDHADAAAAYDRALAAMPERQRCAWTDLSWWLDGPLASDYRRQPCGPARDAWERRFWDAARPLLALPGNDLRAELLARRTMSRIRSQGAFEYAMAWGDDVAELEARYGWPTAWSARDAGSSIYSGQSRSVVGHEPTPSYAFVPRLGAVQRPTASAEDDWELAARLATMRYAPRYAWHGVGPLAHQLARFRRGDSTLVVAAWDATLDRDWRRDTLAVDSTRAPRAHVGDTTWAALVLVDSTGRALVIRRDSVTAHGTLTATVAAAPYLASLELLATPRGRAARARHAIAPLPPDTLVSDLLLLRDLPAPGTPVERIGDLALGARTIAPGARIGLYWETYGDSATTAVVEVQATRVGASFAERVGRVFGIGGPRTPVAVRFVDTPRPGEQAAGRTLAVTWPADVTGTFRVEVTVRSGERAVTAATEIRVAEPKR